MEFIAFIATTPALVGDPTVIFCYPYDRITKFVSRISTIPDGLFAIQPGVTFSALAPRVQTYGVVRWICSSAQCRAPYRKDHGSSSRFSYGQSNNPDRIQSALLLLKRCFLQSSGWDRLRPSTMFRVPKFRVPTLDHLPVF